MPEHTSPTRYAADLASHTASPATHNLRPAHAVCCSACCAATRAAFPMPLAVSATLHGCDHDAPVGSRRPLSTRAHQTRSSRIATARAPSCSLCPWMALRPSLQASWSRDAYDGTPEAWLPQLAALASPRIDSGAIPSSGEGAWSSPTGWSQTPSRRWLLACRRNWQLVSRLRSPLLKQELEWVRPVIVFHAEIAVKRTFAEAGERDGACKVCVCGL